MPDVVLLGCCVTDHLVRVSEMPQAEGVAVANGVERRGGGMAANVAVALTRLGRSCGLIAALGDDESSEELLRELSAEGVDVTHTVRRADTPSTHVMLLIGPGFERSGIFIRPQTLLSLRTDELDQNYVGSAKVVFTDLEPAEAGLEAAALARAAGKVVVVDIQAATTKSQVLGITQSIVERAVALCDLLLPSEEGLLSLTGHSTSPSAVRSLCAEYPTLTVAVTLGPRGSIVGRGTHQVRVPAYEVPVVDTTGAGDVYHAALIEGLYFRNWGLAAAGHFASAAAALACTQLGARAGAPTYRAVRRRMRPRTQDAVTSKQRGPNAFNDHA